MSITKKEPALHLSGNKRFRMLTATMKRCRIIEGMAIAAYAIGASQGYIYVRGEYPLDLFFGK
ncbi:MAG: hypothetical protein AAF383_28200 [Cyanobacteria bacterium P01_A01_bin.83]